MELKAEPVALTTAPEIRIVPIPLKVAFVCKVCVPLENVMDDVPFAVNVPELVPPPFKSNRLLVTLTAPVLLKNVLAVNRPLPCLLNMPLTFIIPVPSVEQVQSFVEL